MKVWFCETHNTVDFDVCLHGGEPPCRMVEMQLVPVDARGELQCPNCKFVYEAER